MTDIVKLETLEIEFPQIEDHAFHNEGFMNSYEFYNKISNLKNGRNLWMLEIANMDMGQEYGALESYIKEENGKKIRHTHIYCEKSIEKNYPINIFVKAHEETHSLEPRIANQYPLLLKKLISRGIKTTEFEKLDEEQIAHLGGLVGMTLKNIKIGNDTCVPWITFKKQTPGLIENSPDFKKALDWFLRNKTY